MGYEIDLIDSNKILKRMKQNSNHISVFHDKYCFMKLLVVLFVHTGLWCKKFFLLWFLEKFGSSYSRVVLLELSGGKFKRFSSLLQMDTFVKYHKYELLGKWNLKKSKDIQSKEPQFSIIIFNRPQLYISKYSMVIIYNRQKEEAIKCLLMDD